MWCSLGYHDNLSWDAISIGLVDMVCFNGYISGNISDSHKERNNNILVIVSTEEPMCRVGSFFFNKSYISNINFQSRKGNHDYFGHQKG